MLAILMGEQWYLIVILICTPPMTNEIEHLFLYFLSYDYHVY